MKIKLTLLAAVFASTLAFSGTASAQQAVIPIIVKDTTSFYWQIVLAGARKGRWPDHLVRVVGLFGYSVPVFWLGLVGLGLVGQGLSNDEIGNRLFVSPATARTHVSRAMIKLNARDRAQLAVFALRSGLAR